MVLLGVRYLVRLMLMPSLVRIVVASPVAIIAAAVAAVAHAS